MLSSPWQTVVAQKAAPEIGAEVFIEPGQCQEEIDVWFRRMKEGGMTVTRIRMFESYMHKPDGTWDYTLFDYAFKSAEKYGIKIYCNLFPLTSFTDVGGFKFPRDDAHLYSIADYIKNLVTHFQNFKSCYGWVPINEPGAGGCPDEEFTRNKFQEWKVRQPVKEYMSKGYEHFDFADERFLLDYNTWFLKWLTDKIRKYAPAALIHVNNHAVFQNIAEYNFPEWRKFLTSLGASAHASWHFGYFRREQYALAVSANSEIIRSGAGNIPWLMTELQGGNNTYSSYDPMCPTKEEISQWLWITIGTGGKGAIFWSLNPRSSGFEAGEWALLNFQNEPSDRMNAASAIAGIIRDNETLFADSYVAESGINILYTRESLWIEKKMQVGGSNYEGRNVGGVMKSALAYFEALSEMGIQSNFKAIGEFDFTKGNYAGVTIILAHQISIPSNYWHQLEHFVNEGGKLIAEGLTAYYDENALSIMKTGFPLQKLFGGNIAEFKLVNNLFELQFTGHLNCFPAHLWQGSIKTTTAKPLSLLNNEVLASRNKYGNGEVLWLPSLIGLGSRIKKDYQALSSLLSEELKASIKVIPFIFKALQSGMLMKTLRSQNSYITIIINKSKDKREVELEFAKDLKLKPTILCRNKEGGVSENTVAISPEETLVIHWV